MSVKLRSDEKNENVIGRPNCLLCEIGVAKLNGSVKRLTKILSRLLAVSVCAQWECNENSDIRKVFNDCGISIYGLNSKA